jgi:hypothetical protein
VARRFARQRAGAHAHLTRTRGCGELEARAKGVANGAAKDGTDGSVKLDEGQGLFDH